jgi:ATP-dependent Clp protease adaptor protein ClpS
MFWVRNRVSDSLPQANMSTHSHPSTIELPDLVDADIDAFFAIEDLWAVIVWNDDVTTFQTVIQAFVEIFGHTVERADQLAWTIHRTGKAVAAVRRKEEAEAAVHELHLRKIQATMARA